MDYDLFIPPDLLTHMQKGSQEEPGPGGHQEEEDRVTELPEIPQLQHLAKARPKRPKKHASSKNVVKVIILAEQFSFISLIVVPR